MEKFRNSEKLGQPVSNYRYIIIRPGGNDTCLIKGIIENIKQRKLINNKIMKIYPNVEQVGFVNLDSRKPELIMAGGEFCANATRSTAYLALKGKPGKIRIKVSGVKKELIAGITKNGEAFAQMPIYDNPKKITRDPANQNGYIVELEGITHYINFNEDEIKNLSLEKIKIKAKKTIDKLGLNKYPASGVIYVSKKLAITPVIWVKKINTLFLETACGSGTAALGQVLALKSGKGINNIPIIQPSGMPIKVLIDFDGKKFKYTQIQGPIKILERKTLCLS